MFQPTGHLSRTRYVILKIDQIWHIKICFYLHGLYIIITSSGPLGAAAALLSGLLTVWAAMTTEPWTDLWEPLEEAKRDEFSLGVDLLVSLSGVGTLHCLLSALGVNRSETT